jgi:hypothetical protein
MISGWPRLAAVAVMLSGLSMTPQPAGAQVVHLDADTRREIASEDFHAVKKVSQIPQTVIDAAGAARGEGPNVPALVIAEPGAPYQATDVISGPPLPGRRLVVAWTGDSTWILHYEAGGVAHTYHVAVFDVVEGKAKFLWQARVREKLTSVDELRTLIRHGDPNEIDDSYTKFY